MSSVKLQGLITDLLLCWHIFCCFPFSDLKLLFLNSACVLCKDLWSHRTPVPYIELMLVTINKQLMIRVKNISVYMETHRNSFFTVSQKNKNIVLRGVKNQDFLLLACVISTVIKEFLWSSTPLLNFSY